MAEKLGRSPFADRAHADILIDGEESAADDTRWRAHIAQRDRGGTLLGEREIHAKSCASLLRAATVVVALFIDPNREQEPVAEEPPPRATHETVEPSPNETAPAPPPAPVVALPRPMIAKPSASVSVPTPFQLRLGAGISGETGLLPSFSGSVLALARLEKPGSRLSFDWALSYAWPQTLEQGPVRGHFSVLEQRLRGCVAFVDARVIRGDACAGGFFGAIIPRTVGVLDRSDAWRRIGGPTAAVAFQVPRGPTAVRLELGLDVPIQRYAFTYVSNEGESKRFYTTDRTAVFVAFGGLHTIL
ncbi:hypothetical protein [Labilithrix luteola]|uniref:hypothetical protein n=1 Tax=Labilithrix luteola TaxID=1391654 RepID=UPI0011BA5634|nr:hypothetical protein [Labilithrix luteola]